MYNTIIVPIDLGHAERSTVMIETARKLGNDGAKIVLVHIVDDIPTYVAAELPTGVLEDTRVKARDMLEDIAKAAGISSHVEVRSGHPATSIIAAAEEYSADAIIIASHRPGWQDFLLGSTAARVVRHAQCSVFVLR